MKGLSDVTLRTHVNLIFMFYAIFKAYILLEIVLADFVIILYTVSNPIILVKNNLFIQVLIPKPNNLFDINCRWLEELC